MTVLLEFQISVQRQFSEWQPKFWLEIIQNPLEILIPFALSTPKKKKNTLR